MHGLPEEIKFKLSSDGQDPAFDALGIEVVMHYDPDFDFWIGTDPEKRFEGILRIDASGKVDLKVNHICKQAKPDVHHIPGEG